MSALVAVGAQWGDEGQGQDHRLVGACKPTSWRASRAATTPDTRSWSTVSRPSCTSCRRAFCIPARINLIGPGVVVDPRVLLE